MKTKNETKKLNKRRIITSLKSPHFARLQTLKHLSVMFMIILVSTLSVYSAFAFAATPNPGHDASSVGEGTFPSGDFRFQDNLNITGPVYVAVDPTGTASNGTIYLGKSSGDGLEYIMFDTSEGGDGKFVVSAPMKVAASSPAITFFDPSQPDNLSRQKSIDFDPTGIYPILLGSNVTINGSLNIVDASPARITFGTGANAETLQFDPSTGEFRFSGGKIAQDFSNIVDNGGFESFSGGSTWSGDSIAAVPDGWSLINGTSYQYAPATYYVGTQVYQGYNALEIDPDGGTGNVTQALYAYKLQPDKTYSVGVWAKVITGGTAKLNVAGSGLSAAFTEQTTTSTTWALLKGQFTTKSTLAANESIVIELKVTGADTKYAFFDAVQLNIGYVLGEYQEAPLTKIGEQTIYGGLRLRRTGYDRGGVLSVDKAVRTRAIEFTYNTDPGWGSLDTMYMNDPRYDWGTNYAYGNVYMELLGSNIIQLTGPAAGSELRFDITNALGPVISSGYVNKPVKFTGNINVTGNATIGGGKLWYNTSASSFYFSNGTTWTEIGTGASSSTTNASLQYGYDGTNWKPLLTTSTGILKLSIEEAQATNATNLVSGATGSDLTLTGNLNVDSGTLWVNASASRVGIGTTSPTQKLHVNGNANITGNLTVGAIVGNGAVPSGMIAIFNTSCPTDWTRVTAFDGKFIRGNDTYGATGGADTHTHDAGTLAGPSHSHTFGSVISHTHSVDPPSKASGTQSADHTHTGPSHQHSGPSHTHSVSGTAASGGGHQHSYTAVTLSTYGDYAGSSHDTGEYISNSGAAGTYGGDGAHGHSVSGTAAADGTGNTGAEGTGATSGTSADHTHSTDIDSFTSGSAGSASAATNTSGTDSVTGSTASGSTLPPYIDVVFCMKDTVSGSDLAEIFLSDEQSVEEGDVLVVGSGAKNVKKSTEIYQKELLGVVSAKPGYILSDGDLEPMKNKVIVGLIGRVPVKVSTENGMIEVGDYLTSSSKPGVAMKATGPGPVVGKALETYDKNGAGKIMVFINLGWYGGEHTSETEDKMKKDVISLKEEVNQLKAENEQLEVRLARLEAKIK